MTKKTAKDLIIMGFPSGPHIPAMVDVLNDDSLTDFERTSKLFDLRPPEPIPLNVDNKNNFSIFITANDESELSNIDSTRKTMQEVMKTPNVVNGAIMPDACPAGPLGTIPVGGVVVSKAIHPGMHSADVCCSLKLTEYDTKDAKLILDTYHDNCHFGWGGRTDLPYVGVSVSTLNDLVIEFEGNQYLNNPKILKMAEEHLGTCGDGNHFAYVGHSKNSGNVCLVTHHGSRGVGAGLYKAGMRKAEYYRKKLSPDTLKQNAWIPMDTDDGKEYWEALQLVRKWTHLNHTIMHSKVTYEADVYLVDSFWNEHNFVFERDGLYYHAKGATPVFGEYERTIIPLNMAEPILIVSPPEVENDIPFAPHGAGRNYSRAQHRRLKDESLSDQEIFDLETKGIDARFYSGKIDITELPSAYKNSTQVKDDIKRFKLATVINEIIPYGSIMAGDMDQDMPWRKKK